MSKERSEERRNLTIIWRIENLSYWDLEFHGKDIDSPEFRAISLGGQPLLLTLCPKGKDGDDPHLQMLITWFKGRIKHSIDCEWSLLDEVGSPLITETLRNRELQLYEVVDMPVGPMHEEVFVTRKSSFLPLDVLNVQFRIWKSHENLEHSERISAYTRVNAAEKSFEWNIQRFGSLQLDQKISTPVEIRQFPEFQMNFSLMGATLEDARLNFQVTVGESEILNLIIKLSVIKGEKEMKCVEGVYSFGDDIKEQIWDICIKEFVSRKEILDRRSDWLCGDDLTLRCKFIAIKKDLSELIERSYCGPTNPK